MVWREAGMQIDDSNEQSVNAQPAIDESVDPHSNTTLEMRLAKQVGPSSLIDFGIVIAVASPKYSLIDIDFNSTRKSPIILKEQFPSAGMRIDEQDSAEQPSNAKSQINESRESDSNIIVEREEHFWKQQRAIRSRVEGMQIDDSDEQFSNTESPRHES
jgi:hypothetical protein